VSFVSLTLSIYLILVPLNCKAKSKFIVLKRSATLSYKLLFGILES